MIQEILITWGLCLLALIIAVGMLAILAFVIGVIGLIGYGLILLFDKMPNNKMRAIVIAIGIVIFTLVLSVIQVVSSHA